MENGPCTTRVHDQRDKVCRLTTELQTKAPAFQSHHRRRAPRTRRVFAGAAGHRTTTVASAKDKSGFENRRKNDNAFRFVEQVLRKVIGNVENFLENRSAVFQTLRFLFIVLGGERKCEHPES